MKFLFSTLTVFMTFQTFASSSEQKMKLVTLTEIVSHPSLEQAKLGVIEELKAQGFFEGKNMKLVQDNAQGDVGKANLIAKKFVGMKPDLIISISTPSTIAVKQAAKGTSIPIVFVSVSDPVSARLVTSLTEKNSQITGAVATDPTMIKGLQELMKTMIPKMKTIGMVYNSAEANSAKALKEFKASLDPSMKLVEVSVPSSNLVPDAVRSLVKKVDAIYIPLDNTVVSALPKLMQIARENKVPTFSNDPEHVKMGALASYGFSQYAVGQTAGKMAAKILNGEKVENLSIEAPSTIDVSVNKKASELFKTPIPKTFKKIDVKVVSSTST